MLRVTMGQITMTGYLDPTLDEDAILVQARAMLPIRIKKCCRCALFSNLGFFYLGATGGITESGQSIREIFPVFHCNGNSKCIDFAQRRLLKMKDDFMKKLPECTQTCTVCQKPDTATKLFITCRICNVVSYCSVECEEKGKEYHDDMCGK